jgi:hypothetical protein
MVEAVGLKSIAGPLNGITSVSNFMKIYHAVQKLLVGDTQTERQTHRLVTCFHGDMVHGDRLISMLSFLKSRLKTIKTPSQSSSAVLIMKQLHITRTLFGLVSTIHPISQQETIAKPVRHWIPLTLISFQQCSTEMVWSADISNVWIPHPSWNLMHIKTSSPHPPTYIICIPLLNITAIALLLTSLPW